MFPKRLQSGDEIRIIAPSRSMAVIKGEQRRLAEERLANLGFNITYGQYVLEHDDFLVQVLSKEWQIYMMRLVTRMLKRL